MKNAFILLQTLTEKLPPSPPERKHGLHVDGQSLKLTLALNGKFSTFEFEGADLERSGEELAAEILAMWASRPRTSS